MKKIYYFLCSLLPFGAMSQTVQLSPFASGLTNPVDIAHCGDNRLFVAQQNGIIKIVEEDGTVVTDPFLNLSALTTTSGERGLLGIAFHPQYATNGLFFVNYTRATDGATVVARYYAEPGTNEADPDGETILSISQPYSNHNGGCLRFGPDGLLYIAMGDGGSGGDPQNHGQNTQSLLGKMLRINVDESPYGIPATNPYANSVGGLPEIYSIGLRNPWKFAFDEVEGKIWIADVGQNEWEEVNAASINDNSLNYGWRCYEGNEPYNMSGCDPDATYVSPIHVYANSVTACSVTGGYVYRGSLNPDWYGKYFFSDYCSNEIYVLNPTTGNVQTNSGFVGSFATFGQDINGELYVAGRGNGRIYKLTSPTATTMNVDAVELKVFPNPSGGIFEVESTMHVLKADVFNTEGRLVKSIDTPNSIQLAAEEKGLYFVNFYFETGQKTIKLVLE